MAMMVFKTCLQVEDGLPAAIKAKMMMNIIFDFVLGLVPFIGDLADAMFRANTRNAMVLEDYLRERGRMNLKQSGVALPTVDPSNPDEFDRYQRGEPSGSRRPSRNPSRNRSHPASRNPSRNHSRNPSVDATATTFPEPPMPQIPAEVETREGKGKKWGFWGRSQARPSDVETADSGQRRAKLSRGREERPSRH